MTPVLFQKDPRFQKFRCPNSATSYLKHSLLTPQKDEKCSQEMLNYRLALIKNTVANTRFSKVQECRQDSDVYYSCSDLYEKVGKICIWEDKDREGFILSLDDSLYEQADLWMMDFINLTMDEFCKRQHKSLEDLIVHLSKIIFCLPIR